MHKRWCINADAQMHNAAEMELEIMMGDENWSYLATAGDASGINISCFFRSMEIC